GRGVGREWYGGASPSGPRRATPSHSGQAIVTSSTNGRCGSSSLRSVPASSPSSAREPTQVTCPFPHSHSGSGVPQNLVRDSAQSTLFRSHSPSRPYLMPGGCQFVSSFCSSSWSLIAVVRMNQDGSA